MSRIKKEVVIFCILLALISLNSAYADEVGCCTNPGAGALACSTDRLALRDKECCPTPENTFPGYYKSTQNPSGPANSNDCATNFFFISKACSSVDACASGCCCSQLGGSITSGAQCQGTGLTFYKGQTDCSQLCAVPQCNDKIDNDNNGCADQNDTACYNPSVKIESGGTCISQGAGCLNSNYIPKLSSLEITPAKGQRKFLLKWQDECSSTAASYDILRCKGSGCTNFAIAGITNTNSFEDASGDMMFDATYTYQIKSHYSLQSATPTITKTAALGNIECLNQFSSNNFCISQSYYSQYSSYLLANFPEAFSKNFLDGVKSKFGGKFNKAFSCDTFNNLVPEGTSCSSTQACVVDNNKPTCLNKISCNYNLANPFGLFYTLEGCETNRYCFYDRSSTIVNSCFNCDQSMACYDYKTEDACTRDNCRVGNCKWNNLANQIGIGVCVSTTQYNCQWCETKGTGTLDNVRTFNEVFDLCTKEKSDALSNGAFKCSFQNGKSKSCSQVVCRDYSIEQCSNAQIIHDENNKIVNPSTDECGIRACQNINNACVKNADGDNKADCDNAACESDYFAPNTTLLPVITKGKVNSLLVQIYDKTSYDSQPILKTSPEYFTFLCVEPCGAQGHPYGTSTSSKAIIISNLNAYDSNNGTKLLSLNEGTNVIRYYSQDPFKNIDKVNKISIDAHDNTDGPKILSINITDGSIILDKIFTRNQNPTIDVQFFDQAIVTFARLVNKKTGLLVPLQGNTALSAKVSFPAGQILPNGEYAFELNAKNKNNIFMDQPLSQTIVIDNSKPNLTISIANGTVFNTSLVTIKLTFDKEVNVNSIKINSEDMQSFFSTTDNKVFAAAINLSDGNKNLEIAARDFSKNQVASSVLFIVYTHPNTISIVSPKFGVSPKFIFDIVAATDNNAVCRYSIDSSFEYDFMEPFTISGGTTHTISGFSRIASGDTNVHKLYVRCKDQRGQSFNPFDISVDPSPPLLKNVFAYPNPVVEKPSITSLTIESDEPVVCKFSSSPQKFDAMDGKFSGFDNSTFMTINRQEVNVDNEGNYSYYAACQNRAGLISDTKLISFKVDTSVPISIISHTPDYFNSTNAVLAIETNKKSQCKFSESDSTAQSGEIFGVSGYSHTRQLFSPPGKHTFYIVCRDQFLQKFSNVVSVSFMVDNTPPIILYVNDSSTLEDKPEFTWSTDSLRVRWRSIDNESRVSSHLYSLVDSGTFNIIINWATSYVNNEWVSVTNPNGTRLNLANGNKYFFRIKAQNIVGLSSNISESNGVTVDIGLKPLNCTNGAKDEKETDIDCGGICGLCETGKKCGINSDCKTNFCNNGVCSAAKCDDSIKNSDESDADCGGQCKKCQNSKACNSNNDCESGYCGFGTCKLQESCADGNLTPGEADIDCGGPCPAKCLEGKSCSANNDCEESLQCSSSQCRKGTIEPNNTQTCTADGLADSDCDGMSDDWEIRNGLNSNEQKDASMDNDKDGLANLQEYKYQTNPNLADTDKDNFTDKEEVDAKTNPLDPKSHPLFHRGTKILLFVAGTIILLSGFGYLGYGVIARRKKEKSALPRQREIFGTQAQQPAKQAPLSPQKQMEEAKAREALKQRERQKIAERKKIFEAFGKEGQNVSERATHPQLTEKPKEEVKEVKTEKPEVKEAREEKKKKESVKLPKKKPAEKRIQSKNPKEDVFVKLKKIAKEEKKKKLQSKNAKK